MLPALTPCLRDNGLHRGLGGHQVGLGRLHGGLLQFDLHFIGFLVEFDKQVPLVHAIVVIDRHPCHLTRDAGGHKGYGTLYIGVVGRDGTEGAHDRGDSPYDDSR